MKTTDADIQLWQEYKQDWNKFAVEVLNVDLDEVQKEILEAIQKNRRISVRSGHSRGKDYVAAIASLCFLYLLYPSKVINTAPTGRQVVSIMMAEIGKVHKNANIRLPGEVLATKIKFKGEPDWFMEGFKAADKATEDWTGFHSPNLMLVVTEASGIEQETFNAIEGLLTGNSKLLIIFNPNRTTGEAYQSTRSPRYKKFKLNCLDAPNVIAKKILIPGQVDYVWVKDKIIDAGWCLKIDKSEMSKSSFDFIFEKQAYRPNDLFRKKVLGEFPAEAEGQLIPLAWVEAANERWLACKGKGEGKLSIGLDVAGEGNDLTVWTFKRGNVIESQITEAISDHMSTAGKTKNYLKEYGSICYVDALSEGAGTFKRLKEQNQNVIGWKGSHVNKEKHDYTGERTFHNMRAWVHWMLRDYLNPQYKMDLALPPDDMLTQEITEPQWDARSNGDIIIEPKDDIKKRLGHSPDKMDSVLLAIAGDFHVKPSGVTMVPAADAFLKRRF